ncbi:hypothetical protein CRG98_034533 [Punica granatum]|uniref:Uncharacterized protein n=1 Tax=Punica granatum TaxID=22663 RepID=A0A2I0IM36_PUNGR|nr:hypothetical protein CRG98_034533 [Punica granatum]
MRNLYVEGLVSDAQGQPSAWANDGVRAQRPTSRPILQVYYAGPSSQVSNEAQQAQARYWAGPIYKTGRNQRTTLDVPSCRLAWSAIRVDWIVKPIRT